MIDGFLEVTKFAAGKNRNEKGNVSDPLGLGNVTP